jgi:hemerythrin-like domain-containing protein
MNGECGCSGYLKHLQVEHRQLNHLLGTLEQQLTGWREPTVVPPGFADHLQDLQRMLVAHFVEEEEGGCLEEAVVRCPQLGPQRTALEAEHGQLKQQLENLVEHVRHPHVGAPHVRTAYRAFADQLRAHEAGESEVLERAFGGEVSEYDREGTY